MSTFIMRSSFTPITADGGPISADMTVNDVARRYPETLGVFHAWGIDSCCGGALALGVVADRHHLSVPDLLRELNEAVGR